MSNSNSILEKYPFINKETLPKNKNKQEITEQKINKNQETTQNNISNNVNEKDILSKYKLSRPYDSMSEDEKKELFRRLDNFLEAIYLSPTYFPKDILFALKFREERLSFWRLTGQIFGAATFSTFWIIYKLRINPNFFFRNFCYYSLLAGLSAYAFGRFFEFHSNVRYYREMIFKIANDYNISDDEITELQQKFNEFYLKENQNKNSLDSVKFKL